MCPQTDGASAVLIMSEEKALAMGFKPKAYLRYPAVKQMKLLLLFSLLTSFIFFFSEILFLCPRTPKISCFWGECSGFHRGSAGGCWRQSSIMVINQNVFFFSFQASIQHT